MFGNLVNNKQLLEMCEAGSISIKPFDEERLKAVHYPLTASIVLNRQDDGSWKRQHYFEENQNSYVLEPNEYVVIEITEQITVKEGIVAQFLPASNLIEAGIGLTAGRLEYPFGQRGESIRFGLRNLLGVPNEISIFHKVAYVQFFDLRGLATKFVVVTQRELNFWADRIEKSRRKHAEDAGPFYPGEGSSYQIDTSK